MRLKAYAAGLGAAVIAVAAFAVDPAEAQTTKKRYVTAQPSRVATAGRPKARITVAPRSFLDAGTEVLPGERKFTDYAFPPAVGYPSFARENLNRPIDRQPLSPPADVGGYPQNFPLY